MECINELKKIGIQEINAKTKIATKRLDDILECKFDEIDRTRVKGFIYILQREYKIDMSEWLEKYDEYHREKEELNIDSEAIKDNKSDNVNIAFVDTTIKDKTYTRLATIFVILVILFVIYFVYNNLIKDNNVGKSDNNYSNTTNIINNYIEDTNATISNDDNKSINLSTLPNETINNNEIDNDIESLNNQNETSNIDNTTDSNIDHNASVVSNNNINSMFGVDEMVITPKSPLWIGIIDLQTYKKKQVSVSNSFTIDLDDSKIIRTGHGYFDLKSKYLNENYIGGDSKYFIYTKEDGLKEISKEEFLGFNRGKEW